MSPKFVVEGLYPHMQDSSFITVIRRDDGLRYAILTGSFGSPCVYRIEGRIIVRHIHTGYGSYRLQLDAEEEGEKDYSLDPICQAVMTKGWNLNHLQMELRVPGIRDRGSMLDFHLSENLPVKERWDGSSEKYLISSSFTDCSMRDGIDHAIYVHLADHNHFGIHVVVPQIYTGDNLENLLEAIDSLPEPRAIPDIHPAALYSG